ncbi:MAG TPA: hypothetical protein VGH87_27780 [Polyangiaceae bacterium]|jgi:hypothetical protein
MRILVLLALVACQSGEPAAAKQPASSASAIASGAPVTTAAPSAPACIAASLVKGGDVVGLYAKGDHALACYAEENADAGTCAEIDVATGAIVATQKWHREAAGGGEAEAFTVTATTDAAKICKATTTDCATVKLSLKKNGERKDVVAAANDDGTRLFVLAPEQKPNSDPTLTTSWTTFGDTYDVKTGKRVAHQRLTNAPSNAFSDMSNTWSARFDGKNLVLGDYVCCGPGGTSMLFDPDKGVVKRLHGYAGSYREVSGHVHAVLDEKKLTFVDFETMQDVGATLTLPGKAFDSPTRTSARAIPVGGKIIVAYGSPAGAWILDGATRARSSELGMPACP